MNSLTGIAKRKARIVTQRCFPPVPIRTMDWCAWRDGYEEDGGYGYGATEDEAMAALLAMETDRDD